MRVGRACVFQSTHVCNLCGFFIFFIFFFVPAEHRPPLLENTTPTPESLFPVKTIVHSKLKFGSDPDGGSGDIF